MLFLIEKYSDLTIILDFCVHQIYVYVIEREVLYCCQHGWYCSPKLTLYQDVIAHLVIAIDCMHNPKNMLKLSVLLQVVAGLCNG